MTVATLGTYREALSRLRDVDSLLEATNAGVCIIHLTACIAALESHIAKVEKLAAGQEKPAAPMGDGATGESGNQ